MGELSGAPGSAAAATLAPTTATEPPRIWVQVAGAVQVPGVYQPAGEQPGVRGVAAAGGFAEEADEQAVALAAAVVRRLPGVRAQGGRDGGRRGGGSRRFLGRGHRWGGWERVGGRCGLAQHGDGRGVGRAARASDRRWRNRSSRTARLRVPSPPSTSSPTCPASVPPSWSNCGRWWFSDRSSSHGAAARECRRDPVDWFVRRAGLARFCTLACALGLTLAALVGPQGVGRRGGAHPGSGCLVGWALRQAVHGLGTWLLVPSVLLTGSSAACCWAV